MKLILSDEKIKILEEALYRLLLQTDDEHKSNKIRKLLDDLAVLELSDNPISQAMDKAIERVSSSDE